MWTQGDPAQVQRAELVPHDAALASPDPMVRLKAHAVAALVALAPASLAMYIGVNRRHEVVEGIALQADDLRGSLPHGWRRYTTDVVALDPFAAARVRGPDVGVAVLGELPADEAVACRDYLLRYGVVDRADVYVRASGSIVASIALARARRLGRFTPGELTALRRVQPLIEHAYACAAEPTTLPVRAALCAGGLTEREADVAVLVGRGATNAEIACALHLTETTVKTHLTRIYAKLEVRTRTQLAMALRRLPEAEPVRWPDGEVLGPRAAGGAGLAGGRR